MTKGLLASDPLMIAEAWSAAGRAVALATVVETWGSAPRPVGSHLVVDAKGHFEGSVSGGCVEGDVIAEAMDILSTGQAKTLEFGVDDETAWRQGLSCGGRIRIYVERLGLMKAGDLTRLNAARRARKAVMRIIDMADGTDRLVIEGGAYDDAYAVSLRAAFSSGKSGLAEIAGRSSFLNTYLPTQKIVVIGAVHISQVLAPMADMAGFDVSVIDPRTAFATPERFANIDLFAEWPEDVLKTRPLDAYTALAALTHDPRIDDWPLAEALRAGCFYVGALGSRKTQGSRAERLSAEGFGSADLQRIHAPIGLDIGAANPAEIAVAILAEIIKARRKPFPTAVNP